MTIKNTFSSESWDKIYTAFQQINFTSYDYDTVKESLLQYLKIYYPEHYSDFIESSELIAILELFAYSAELLAYRVDTMSHENFMSTAQRKQSVLRLAKLVSYKASRNIPARGLVKINTVRTTEAVYDSLGNNLANTSIFWNDQNNSNWKEQFFLVMNKVMTSRFGQPSKAFQIGDVSMQIYTFNNISDSFRNGVFAFSAASNSDSIQMEAVPADIDENGPFERAPDLNSQFNIIYATDGKGDGSDFTGFLMFVKQGSLIRTDYTITEPIINRKVGLDAINVNDTDVWVYRVNDNDEIVENWTKVETLNEQNLVFNNTDSNKKKYEVETLENDKIALIFGDGNFSDVPVGKFQLWTRVSLNENLMIPKNKIIDQQMSFSYANSTNSINSCALTFSLTSAIQNNAASESIEHIRQSAPATYYAQNRMVNGQDYNTYPLKDPTILRLKTINRTFAGQPKYIEWNDASRTYENIKLFGDDLTLTLDISADMVESRASSKTIIDTYIEPLLQTNALLNTLTHVISSSNDSYGIISYPRRKFIEDNRTIFKDINGQNVNPYGKQLDGNDLQSGDGSLNEKTMIQAALDQHWYGEPVSYATINTVRHAVILDPLLNPKDDGKIYVSDIPRTIDGANTYPPGDVGSGIQTVSRQPYFGLKFNRFLSMFGNGDLNLMSNGNSYGHGDVTPCPVIGLDYYKHRMEVITIEMTSDMTTFTVISSIRGALPNYSLNAASLWSDQTDETLPFDFSITNGTTKFEAGDAFIVDISFGTTWTGKLRTFGTNNTPFVNLTGWWELIPAEVISALPTDALPGAGIFVDGPSDGPNLVQQMSFDQSSTPNSWVFLISRKDNVLGEVDSWNIYNRNMKIVAESLTTKFWHNQNSQIIDSLTKKPVFDKIRVLRSNLDEKGLPLKTSNIYDVVDYVYNSDGEINFNQLEVLPSDTINFTQAGDKSPDNLLQFEMFSAGSYEFFAIDVSNSANPEIVSTFACSDYIFTLATDPLQINLYDAGTFFNSSYGTFTFNNGNLISNETIGDIKIGRKRKVPAPAIVDPASQTFGCNLNSGLDFMWQHFSPVTNLVDPSVTNIHDAFLLTRGYHTSVMDYVKGFSNIVPQPPTPLDLRTSYGYILQNKMLSDTVVLHSGKIKLLFGDKADQRLKAKFRVVKSPSATFSDERIKSEIISVIDLYFDIQNWDFGDKFYATELIALIHQRLPTQIASVVIVPTYSVNSFGSLFTIDSGFDEVLQSAATINDVEIVDALTSAVLRQVR